MENIASFGRVMLEMLLLLAGYGLTVTAVVLTATLVRRPLDRGSLVLFIVSPMVFLLPGFAADRTPLPLDHVLGSILPWTVPRPAGVHNPSLSDVATQFVPWAKAVRMALKEGSFPFWNRWNGCGMPLAANGQSQAFSPFTLLTLALPLARSFVLLGAAKLFIALSGTWLWVREIGSSASAARFGAISFAFSFAITPWLYHPASAVICLWPWAFFALELLDDPLVSRRGFVLLVVILTAWPLCGHLETVTLGAFFGGAWLGLRALRGDIIKPSRVLGGASLAALIALGLSAFSLVPQMHAIEASNRIVLAKDPSHLSFVPWVPYQPGWLGGFVTSLFPRAFGDMIESPMIPGAAGSIVEMGFGYFGVVGWACVLLGFRRGSRRDPKEWILITLTAFGLGGAMGLPIFRSIVGGLPGIGLVPPLRLLLFASAAGVPLAVFEIDRLVKDYSLGRADLRVFFGASAFVAGLAVVVFASLRGEYAIAGGLSAQISALRDTLAVLLLATIAGILVARRVVSARAFVGLITVVAFLELLPQGARLYHFFPTDRLYPQSPLFQFLHARPLPYRVVGDGGALFPNTNVFALVESIGTHDPAERRDYVEFLDRTAGYPPFEYFKKIAELNSPVLDFLNVRYLVAPPGRAAPAPKWSTVYSGPSGIVFENRDILPRVFAPQAIHLVPSTGNGDMELTNSVLAFGNSLDRLFKSRSFLDEAVVLENPSLLRLFPRGGQNGFVKVSMFSETTNRIRFRAAVSGGPSVLVSSLVTDGGWSARDETGKRIPISLANGPFLAVCLHPGDHVVTLSYSPPGFRAGVTASIVTALTLVAAQALRKLRAIRARTVSG